MFFTTYKLALEAGLDISCEGFRTLVQRYGSPVQYGETEPLRLSQVLKYGGLEASLWSLRAVYPEQIVAAQRVSRDVIYEACSEGNERFEVKPLRDAFYFALGLSDGDTLLADASEHRKRVRPFATHKRGRLQLYSTALLHFLSDRPERYALSAYKLGLEICEEGESRDAFEAAISDDMASVLEDASEDGPGVIVEPSGRGRPRNDGLPSGSIRTTPSRSKLTFRHHGVKGTSTFDEAFSFMRER